MKRTIVLQCLIAILCFILTLTSLPADNADLTVKTRSGRESRELEQSESRTFQTKQIMYLTEDYFQNIFEFSACRWFLAYVQHNYQSQVQRHILAAHSIHSPPSVHYS